MKNFISMAGLLFSTVVFLAGIILLFGVIPFATAVTAFDDDSDIDPNTMLALLPVSVSLMFIGGVGISTFTP